LAVGSCGSLNQEFCNDVLKTGCASVDYGAFAFCSDKDLFAKGCKYYLALSNSDCQTGLSFQKIWQAVGGDIGNNS